MASSPGRRFGGSVPRAAAVAFVVALMLGGIAVGVGLLYRGDEVVVLEPANSPGEYPFLDVPIEAIVGSAPDRGTVLSGNVAADAPGLFSGQGHEICDQGRIGAALGADPARAAAWGEQADVGSADVGSHVAGLTPIVLRSDTAVTQHGYRDGGSVDYPAILQRGTAVLVNQVGQPVAKCAGGNPLTSPETTGSGEPSGYVGPAWPGFSPSSTTVIRAAVNPIDVFTVVDPTSGRRQPLPAGLGGGSTTAVARAEAPWDLDAIDADDRFFSTFSDVQQTLNDRCLGTPGLCLKVDYRFDVDGKWLSVGVDETPPACDGTVYLCHLLQSIEYDPEPTKLVDGVRVECDPEVEQSATDCDVQIGTRIVVKISRPLTQLEQEKKAARVQKEIDKKKAEAERKAAEKAKKAADEAAKKAAAEAASKAASSPGAPGVARNEYRATGQSRSPTAPAEPGPGNDDSGQLPSTGPPDTTGSDTPTVPTTDAPPTSSTPPTDTTSPPATSTPATANGTTAPPTSGNGASGTN